MTKIPKLKILFLLSTFYFLLSGLASAAELFFDAQTQEFAINQQFQVDLLLDAENKELNAVEGKILFPVDLLELKQIKDGGSIINFWVEKPAVVMNDSVVFSGIIPGGFRGVFGPFYKGLKPGKILSLIFQTQKEGEGAIEINEAKVLLNDGKGTPAQLSIINYQFSISEKILVPQIPIPKIEDTEPPEPFTPEITRDPNIFEGQWFLVFASQDKNSGIAHYEILEKTPRQSLFNKFWQKEQWITAESPYLLKDQKLKSYVSVKALNKAGNERTASLPPSRPLAWYENYLVWGIIILIIIAGLILRFLLWKKIGW